MMEWGQAGELVAGRTYRLTLFGNFSLCTAHGEAIGGLSRKAKGLIAYLALACRGASRDRLAELLWDGRGVEQARASLRQACYELRHHLPADAPLLIFERDEIRLIADNLTSDIDDLNDAPQRLLEALAPARRELLRDLNGLSPAFDEWLRIERSRLSDERRALALETARDDLAARRWSAAKQIACSLLTLHPTDEEAMEVALRAIGESGDLKEAQSLYTRHAEALRHELDVDPTAGNAALLRELAQALHCDKRPPAGRRLPAGESRRLAPPETPSRPMASRRWTAGGIFLGVAAVVAIVGATQFRHTPASAEPALVEVEPLTVDAGDQAAAAVSAGLRSSLVQELAGTQTPVEVVDSTGGSADPIALRVRGNSLDDHGRLRANLELVAGSSGKVVWAASFDRPDTELNQFEHQVSLQIAHELHCAYGDGRAAYFARDPEFARLTLAHCDKVGKDFEESARFAADIAQRAPGFARGWAEYAMDTATITNDLPPALQQANERRADSFARRALALDPKQGLAYAALIENLGPSSWTDRQRIETRGLAADPTSPELHFRLADNLGSIGRVDDALREARLSYQYDHFLPPKVFLLGATEMLEGDFGGASDALAIARKYWPGHPWFDFLAVDLGLAGTQPAEAMKVLARNALRLDPERTRALEAVLEWRIAPSSANRLAAVHSVQAAARKDGAQGQDVRLLAILGDVDGSYHLADQMTASQAGDSSAWFGPGLERFRSDPRFMRLAARLGLARIWWQTGLWPDFCLKNVSRCRTQVAAALAEPRASGRGRA